GAGGRAGWGGEGEGAASLLHAAELCARPERAAELLRAAAAADPGSATVLAPLARAEEGRGALEAAETAAARALGLAAACVALDPDARAPPPSPARPPPRP